MIILQNKAEFNRQEVVTNKGHQQNEVVYYFLDVAVLYRLEDLFKLLLKVLSDDVDHD